MDPSPPSIGCLLDALAGFHKLVVSYLLLQARPDFLYKRGQLTSWSLHDTAYCTGLVTCVEVSTEMIWNLSEGYSGAQ